MDYSPQYTGTYSGHGWRATYDAFSDTLILDGPDGRWANGIRIKPPAAVRDFLHVAVQAYSSRDMEVNALHLEIERLKAKVQFLENQLQTKG